MLSTVGSSAIQQSGIMTTQVIVMLDEGKGWEMYINITMQVFELEELSKSVVSSYVGAGILRFMSLMILFRDNSGHQFGS